MIDSKFYMTLVSRSILEKYQKNPSMQIYHQTVMHNSVKAKRWEFFISTWLGEAFRASNFKTFHPRR